MDKAKLNLIFGQMGSFLLIQIAGLFTGLKFFSLPEFKERIFTPSLSLADFFIAFISAVLFIFLVLKIFKKRKFPFKLIFYFLVFTTGSLVFLIWFPNSFLPFLIIIFLFLLLHFFPNVICQNILIAICVVGAGVFLGGSLFPFQMILILLILAVYDLIMVFGSGQMIEMFKKMLASRLILALTIPERLKDFTTKISEVEIGKGFVFLGTGDLALPLAFAISALRQGLISSVFIILGSFLGLLILTFFFLKERQPLPALPPIIAGGILGYFISLL
ncbi:MAG: presenilin family intramembrane aspartyl protease [Patescibacteria group bacterium]|nr:presenilin family intramembrane aspartyl protease [Patescibacteria group bacterium]